jgi:hypothetical protein
MTLQEALDAYREMFNDIFPLRMVMEWTNDEIIAEIISRLESGEPFEGDEGLTY